MEYDYSETVNYLLDWYDLNSRILPWRENPTPYYVWISEIMLQQTRVEAVKLYFERFINTLPDIKSLALVEEEKLLKLWEGLGYYNRARNLQKAAGIIMTDYNGEIPPDYDKLLKLPGIGSYTAGAIASMAFRIPVPAVDGNVLRVMKRVAGSFDNISQNKVIKELRKELEEIIPRDRPGAFNQALMDLGAAVCIPNGKPLCEQCPIMHLCKAFRNDTWMKIPVKAEKKARKIENRTVLLIEQDGRYMLHKREGKGLLAGLWEFPNTEGKLTKKKLTGILTEMGIEQCTITKLNEGKHIFSHIEWHMTGYHIKLHEESALKESAVCETGAGYISGPYVWADRNQIKAEYTLPTAFHIYRKHILESD